MSESSPSRPRRFDREVDGILLLDKPSGMSSNSALQQARRCYRALKAGHAGSLDPLASGLLPVCFGQATKVCGQLLDSAKTYRVVAKLGEQTDTADAEGQVISRMPVPRLDSATVRAVLDGFLGAQEQVPPMYSALKHGGQRLYELARRGESVERAPRQIRITRLELMALDSGAIELEVDCSKGTYVRTLVEDVARALGTVAHVTALRRLKVDSFGDQAMIGLQELEQAAEEGRDLAAWLLPVDHVFAALPRAEVDGAGEGDLLHGRRARSAPAEGVGGTVRVYGPGGRFIGLAERDLNGLLQPSRLFVPAAGPLDPARARETPPGRT
jgi:tRNA pseudouridine55 synthase